MIEKSSYTDEFTLLITALASFDPANAFFIGKKSSYKEYLKIHEFQRLKHHRSNFKGN
jgi:hypothetical protein